MAPKQFRKFNGKRYEIRSFFPSKRGAEASKKFARLEHNVLTRIVPGMKKDKKGYYTYVRKGKK